MATFLQEGQEATDPKTGETIKNVGGRIVTMQPSAPGASYVPPASVISSNSARVKGIADDANIMNSLADQARVSIEHNRKTSTGFPLNIPFVGDALLGISKQFNPDLAVMDSNAVNMAKSMRAQGQRLTQMEWLKNLTAVPSPKNSGTANAEIADNFVRGADVATVQTSFFQNWMKEHNNDLTGADAAWRTYRTQHYNADNTPKTSANPGPQFKYLGRTK